MYRRCKINSYKSDYRPGVIGHSASQFNEQQSKLPAQQLTSKRLYGLLASLERRQPSQEYCLFGARNTTD
jgi:hypothetical protein